MDIDELIGETEAALNSLLSLATGATSEELKNDLESGVVFQQECVWRMNDLTLREAVEEGCEDEEKNDRIQDDEGADGVSNQRGGRGRGGEERESNTGMKRTRGREMWEKEKEDERKGEAQKNEMEGERDGRKDIRDEEEEEDEEIKLARKTICEAVRSLDDLTSTPRPAVSVLQATRLKPEQNPRKRTDSHSSNTPGPFGGGEPVREKPRPLLSQQSRVNFTIESLEQELASIMDTCFQDDGASGDDVKFTTTTTITTGLTTPTATDTTYTTTAPAANDITAVTPPPATDMTLPTALLPVNTTTTLITDDTNTNATCISTATTPTTPITTTTAPHSPITPTTPTVIITTPTNPTSEDIINTTTNKPTTPATIASDTAPNTPSTPSPPGHQRDTTPEPTTPTPLSTTPTDTQVFIYPRTSPSSTPATTPSSEDSDIHKHDNQRHHRFSSLMDGMKNLNWRNSLKKKKKRRNIEISDPTDFRQLKAITSIKPVQDLKGTAAQNGVRKGTERGQ